MKRNKMIRLRKLTAAGITMLTTLCVGLLGVPVVDVFADILEPNQHEVISKSVPLNNVTPCGGDIDDFLEELEAEEVVDDTTYPEEELPELSIEELKYDPNTDIHVLIKIVADEIGLDWRILEGIVYAESSFNPECGRGKRYVGLCQVSTTNYNNLKYVLGLSDDYFDRYSNLKCGAYIYQCLLIKYQDYHKAAVCYNMGEHGAKGIWESGYSRKVVQYARGLGFDR